MSRTPEVNSLIPILTELILAMPAYIPVWHSHCTRASFTVLVSRRDELLTIHSCPLICLQRQIAKLGKGLFYYWTLLRNNNMATNLLRLTSSYDSARGDCWTQASWQVMQRDSYCWQIILYCVKRSKHVGKQESGSGISLCFFKRERRCLFHYSIVGNCMVYQDRIETNLLQILAQHENQEWFSIISAIVFEVNIVAERK